MPQCFDQRYKNRQRRRFRISKRHNERTKVNVNARMRKARSEKREARNESQDGSAVISCLAEDHTFFAYSSRSSVFPSLAGSVTNCASSSCSLGGSFARRDVLPAFAHQFIPWNFSKPSVGWYQNFICKTTNVAQMARSSLASSPLPTKSMTPHRL